MSRLEVRKKSKAQLVVDNLYEDLERRIIASPPGLCPVDMTDLWKMRSMPYRPGRS